MKNSILRVTLALLGFLTTTTWTAADAQTMPPAYNDSLRINYVQRYSAKAPDQSASHLVGRSITDSKLNTIFLDGLGRPAQIVLKQQSPKKADIIAPKIYDQVGHQVTNYIPFGATTVQSSDVLNDGYFKNDPFQQDSVFSKGMYAGQTYFYKQTKYEKSPLGRVLNYYPQGNSWVGGGKGKALQYLSNTLADSVRLWIMPPTQNTAPSNSGIYPAGQLFKTTTTNENNIKTIVFVNKEGLLLLKRQQIASTPGTAHVGWINTYYVYDSLRELRLIIQPKAVDLINTTAGNWTISSTIFNELCFRYEYDYRKRLVISKAAGAGEIWAVFDSRERPVMVQDSNLRAAGKWLVTEYDIQNRPWRTGLLTDAHNRTYHQTLADFSSAYPNTSSGYEVLTQTFYDNYSWVSGTGLSSTLIATYTSNSSYFITSYNSSPYYAQAITANYQTRGMVTGQMVKVVGTTSQYLYSVPFYDDHQRVIQIEDINYTGAKDTTTMQYDFSGKLLRVLTGHQKSGNTAQSHLMLTKVAYDSADRLKAIWKNLDNAAADQLIDSMQYDELGRPHAKYLGANVDSVIFDYNIRGWLTGINKSYVGGTANHYFGMEIDYDQSTSVAPGNTYSNPELTGDIAGITWKSAGAGINRKFDYSYDNDRRLLGASYLQNTTGTTWDKTYIDFSVSGISYDDNGNILTMTQRGFTVGGSSPIDSLTYNYVSNTNKLAGVTDASNNPTSLLGDFHYNAGTKQSTDYTYDGNGNLLQDNNKAITSIGYNYLNLQQLVHISSEGNAAYTYDAMGNKIKKVTTDSLSRRSTTTLYLDQFVYQQTDTITNPGGGTDTLQYVTHEEGRIRWAKHIYTNGSSGFKFEYDFFEKDHLKNTRAVLTQQRDTANYLASMEAAYRSTETQLFANIATTCYPRASVSGYPVNLGITNPNDSVSKLDYNGHAGQKVGPSLLLKVMSGDTINIAVQSYYNTGTGHINNTSFTDVLTALGAGLFNATGGAHGTAANLTASGTPVYTGLTSFLSTDDPGAGPSYPKAYLNWIFLDDQFNYVSSLSGGVAAASSTYPAGQLNSVAPGSPIYLNKSGYLYVWVSNETQSWDVFFDNLSVQHRQGPLLEENHYYPFGLAMQGISDKALKNNYQENKYKFNVGSELQNKEFADGNGLELYETQYRSFDPQLGRFWQVDPLASQFCSMTAYQFAYNNPVMYSDPTGKNPEMGDPQLDMGYYNPEGTAHQAMRSYVEDPGNREFYEDQGRSQQDAMEQQANNDVTSQANGDPVSNTWANTTTDGIGAWDANDPDSYAFGDLDDATNGRASSPFCYYNSETIRTRIAAQLGNTCYPTALAYADNILGDNCTVNDAINMIIDYMTQTSANQGFSSDILTQGVIATGNQQVSMLALNFESCSIFDYGGLIGSLDAGYPVFSSILTYDENANQIYHAIVVVGYTYNSDYLPQTLLYMNPQYGKIQSLPYIGFNPMYAQVLINTH